MTLLSNKNAAFQVVCVCNGFHMRFLWDRIRKQTFSSRFLVIKIDYFLRFAQFSFSAFFGRMWLPIISTLYLLRGSVHRRNETGLKLLFPFSFF